MVGERERSAQRSLVDLVCVSALVWPTFGVAPAGAAPTRAAPDRVRSAVIEATCAAWAPVHDPGAGKSQLPPPPVAGSDGEVCSFARDPEAKLWTFGGYGALVAAMVLIFASMVLGFACAALGMGWRALHWEMWEWRGIQGRV